MRAHAIALTVLALCASRSLAADPAASNAVQPIGKKIADPIITEHSQGKVTVLAFLGTECPLAKLYAPRLADLAKTYGPRGVTFVGVDPNRQDSLAEVTAFARTHQFTFPLVKDLNQTLADKLGVTRTPEVVVLDADKVVRYRGRIDDQYGFQSTKNYQKSQPEKKDLAEALDAVLAGKQVATATTEAAGCLIGRDLKPAANSDVTYSKQIARILNDNCVSCHRPGQIAPFALRNYEEAVGWAAMIDEVVRQERMPPWHADAAKGHFENDARLSEADKAAIAKWVANGAPEGNKKDLPEPPKFADGWLIPKPDQVLYMRDQPYDVPAEGVVPYQMFVADPGWKEDKWITAIEPRPGNPSVVHHILMFVLPPDGRLNAGLGSGNDFLGAFAPGNKPEPLEKGLARFVPAGSKLIFQMHYTPNGSPQKDRSYCGFVFADPKDVKKEVRVTSALNAVFEIPPGNDNFAVKARYIFKDDSLLLTLMPHMHLRGKAFRYEATYPDGRHEVLLNVPRYDFGWQTNYRLSEPKKMPRGTRMDCYAVFDNSDDNLNNPDPKASVRFGDQTFEEMMIGFFEAALVDEDRQDAAKTVKPLSRIEQFNVILAATRGEPDDNVKVGAFMAMADPGIFRQFGYILRTMVPQVDRVCVTAVKDGKLVEIMGPMSQGPRGRHRDDDDENDAEVEKAITEARKQAGQKNEAPQENIFSPLPAVDAKGETLAEIAAGGKPVAIDDLTKAKGKLVEQMVKRGAKSSLHVPAEIQGTRVLINFWSTDPAAFTPPAQALLSEVAKIMAAPKDKNAQAAVK